MGAAQAQHGAGAKDAAILVIPIKVFHGSFPWGTPVSTGTFKMF